MYHHASTQGSTVEEGTNYAAALQARILGFAGAIGTQLQSIPLAALAGGTALWTCGW